MLSASSLRSMGHVKSAVRLFCGFLVAGVPQVKLLSPTFEEGRGLVSIAGGFPRIRFKVFTDTKWMWRRIHSSGS